MKKIILIILMAFFIGGCQDKNLESDALKFKNEYQYLNNLENPNNNKLYSEMNVDEENPIVYADYDKVFEILDGTGVIYFGFAECPWCRVAVPALLEAAKEVKLDTIYYMNNRTDRDQIVLSESKVDKQVDGSKNYYEILEKLGDKASIYDGLNDENIKRLYFPSVVFVKDGKIIHNQVGTVDSQEDPYKKLTDKQYNELKEIYMNNMHRVLSNICEDGTQC